MHRLLLLIAITLAAHIAKCDSIHFDKNDAKVWYVTQTVSGRVIGEPPARITVIHNGSGIVVPVIDGSFTVDLRLSRGLNTIIGSAHAFTPDTLLLTLMYQPVPLVEPVARVEGNRITLSARVIENPYEDSLAYVWRSSATNGPPAHITHAHGHSATASLPTADGKYYFHLGAIARGDTIWYQTFVTREGTGTIRPFDAETEYSDWIDRAVIYEVTPYKFVPEGTLNDITMKLPELRDLGVNTVWLQPVTKSRSRGQGYDVIDYFSVNPALGSAEDLHTLIGTAKDLGLRVILDVVLNHTSRQHPYAQQAAAEGTASHYYDYYQHTFDDAPYSSYYRKDSLGFVYYFWDHLVNLNYNNIEVQQWMIQVCRFWLETFDIDGFRFDAIWAVNARRPDFAGRLRQVLKAVDPDVMLLAEDKGSIQDVYAAGFDVAYDWSSDTAWVSHWPWQYEFSERENNTVFNHPNEHKRAGMLSDAIFKDAFGPRLRFMENNDLPRFVRHHSVEQTRMAAALLFSLPGVPMLYNGQEIGFPTHPYSKGEIFLRDEPIQSMDTFGLFDYYRKLIALRLTHPALTGRAIQRISIAERDGILVFRRGTGDDHITVVLNMSRSTRRLQRDEFSPGRPAKPFIDLLSDTLYPAETSFISVQPHTALWLIRP